MNRKDALITVGKFDNSPVSVKRVRAFYKNVLPELRAQRERITAGMDADIDAVLRGDSEFWQNEAELLTKFFALVLFREARAYFAQSVAVLEENAGTTRPKDLMGVRTRQDLLWFLLNGSEGLKDLSIGIDWDLANQTAAEWARDYGAELVTAINQNTKGLIAEHVSDFIDENGYNLGQLQGNILTELTDYYRRNYDERKLRIRAKNIAITETTRALAQGNKAVWRASGVVEERRWVTNNDDIVCEICQDLDRQVSTLDAPFTSKNGLYVTDLPAHPGCRCFSAPVVRRIPQTTEAETEAGTETVAPPDTRDTAPPPPVPTNAPLEKIVPAASPAEARKRIKAMKRKDGEFRKYAEEAKQLAIKKADELEKWQLRADKLQRRKAAGENVTKELKEAEQKAEDEFQAWLKLSKKASDAEKQYISRLLQVSNPALGWRPQIEESAKHLHLRIEDATLYLNRGINWDVYGEYFAELGLEIQDMAPVYQVNRQTRRSYFDQITRRVNLSNNAGVSTILHETGHHIEEVYPAVHDLAVGFLQTRARDGLLTEIYPGSDEYGWRDQFIDHYMGKYYKNRDNEYSATEIVSMGLEYYFDKPAVFAQKDPEYFDFIYHIAHGNFDKLTKYRWG